MLDASGGVNIDDDDDDDDDDGGRNQPLTYNFGRNITHLKIKEKTYGHTVV